MTVPLSSIIKYFSKKGIMFYEMASAGVRSAEHIHRHEQDSGFKLFIDIY